MFGAFTCTASSTISQMEKMLTVFSPLYELSIFRLVAISNFVEQPVRTSLKQHEGSRAAAGFLDLIDYLFASASCGPIFPHSPKCVALLTRSAKTAIVSMSLSIMPALARAALGEARDQPGRL